MIIWIDARCACYHRATLYEFRSNRFGYRSRNHSRYVHILHKQTIASYNLSTNEILFYFSCVLGFDNVGSQFDHMGNLQDWWLPETRENYLERTKCIIEQYGNYTEQSTGQNVRNIHKWCKVAQFKKMQLTYFPFDWVMFPRVHIVGCDQHYVAPR